MNTLELMGKCFSQFENSLKRAEENLEKIKQISADIKKEHEALQAHIDDAGDHDTCAKCGAIAIIRSDRCGALTIGEKKIEHCRNNCGIDRTDCRWCGQAPLPTNINVDNDCVISTTLADANNIKTVYCTKCDSPAIWNDIVEIWLCPIHFTGMEE